MTSAYRGSDIPGVENSDTGYVDPDIDWNSPTSNASVTPQQDTESLDEAFHEDEHVNESEFNPTHAGSSEKAVDSY